MLNATVKFEVFNTRNGKVYGRYDTLKAASRRQDSEDRKYGAVCTSYRRISLQPAL